MTMTVENRARVAFALVVLLGTTAGLAWYFLASSRYTTFEIRTPDSVSGLIGDSPVEFHGVEVGKVKQVELIDPHTVRILLSVKKDAPITRATVATIIARGMATRGFTGYVYVALDNVGADSVALAAAPSSPFPLIPAAPSRTVTLDTGISEVKQNVQLLTDLVQSVLDRNTVASLKQSVENLQKVTQTLAANDAKLGAIILNTERASASAEQVSANAERASNLLAPLLESSYETVKALQTEVLPEAFESLGKLEKLGTSLNEVAAEFQRDPSVLVRGRSPPSPGPGEKK